jgi:uncharacterized protein YicC (UPF0701 family)
MGAMSKEHKEALAQGRSESAQVRKYLEALEQNKGRRGRELSKDQILKKLSQLEAELATATPLRRLQLRQEKRNLKQRLAGSSKPVDIGQLERDFIKVAASFSARRGIEYSTWREMGVPAEVLSKAGIKRTRGRV